MKTVLFSFQNYDYKRIQRKSIKIGYSNIIRVYIACVLHGASGTGKSTLRRYTYYTLSNARVR